MRTLFISDLHLDPSRPAAIDCFLRFLGDRASSADSLYILGDLFETWIGDDAVRPGHDAVLRGLRRFTDSGIPCHFLHGNRDLLVGKAFSADTGVRLLEEEALIDLAGQRALLMHGDTLCTDDRAYQRYRRIVHQPLIQQAYLALPAGIRAGIAGFARNRSKAANARKAEAIMDTNAGAVDAALRRHGVDLMIHGHTHRPAIHSFEVDGKPARRIVLGAWYEQASVLDWTDQGPELATISFT